MEELIIARLGDTPPAGNRLIVLVATSKDKVEVALDMEGELGTMWARYATVRSAVSGYALAEGAVAASALYVAYSGSGGFADEETPVSIASASADGAVSQSAFPFGHPTDRRDFDQLGAVMAVELSLALLNNDAAESVVALEPDSEQVHSLQTAHSASAARSLFNSDGPCSLTVGSESADGEIHSWKIDADDPAEILFDLPQDLRRLGSTSASLAASDRSAHVASRFSGQNGEASYLICSPQDDSSLGAIEITDDGSEIWASQLLFGSLNDSLLAGVGFVAHSVVFNLATAIEAVASSLTSDEEAREQLFAMLVVIYSHYAGMEDLVPLGGLSRDSVQQWQDWASSAAAIKPGFFSS
jgi:hypothetical protein